MKYLQIYKPYFDNKEIKNINKTIKSGWISRGKLTDIFENKLKIKLKVKNIIAVNSCTSGINLVLNSLKLKRGDEVITTLLTYISTIHTLKKLNLKIKFIDINEEDFSMNLAQLKNKITNKTKLVLVNHYGGIPSKVNEIIKICKKKNIIVVEDAATALGAKLNNKFIGSFNYSTTIFSLQANKTITTGEGGIIATNNNRLAKKIRAKSFNGFQNNDVVDWGFKYNFTDVQAALGLAQLKKLNKIINYRAKLRSFYNKELKILENKNFITLYKKQKNIFISEYIYTIIINEKKCGKIREKLIKFLNKNNIETKSHYLTANKTKYYKNKLNFNNINKSIIISRNILSLPFNNFLKKKDIIFISNCIKKFFKNY